MITAEKFREIVVKEIDRPEIRCLADTVPLVVWAYILEKLLADEPKLDRSGPGPRCYARCDEDAFPDSERVPNHIAESRQLQLNDAIVFGRDRCIAKLKRKICDLDNSFSDCVGKRDRLQKKLDEQTDRAENEAAITAGEFVEQLCMSTEAMKEWVARWLTSLSGGKEKLLLAIADPSPHSYAAGIADAIRILADRIPKPNLLPKLYAKIEYLEQQLSETKPEEAKQWYTDETWHRVWWFISEYDGWTWVVTRPEGQKSNELESANNHIPITKAEADEIRKGWEQ